MITLDINDFYSCHGFSSKGFKNTDTYAILMSVVQQVTMPCVAFSPGIRPVLVVTAPVNFIYRTVVVSMRFITYIEMVNGFDDDVFHNATITVMMMLFMSRCICRD